jgi:hypothetical protein
MSSYEYNQLLKFLYFEGYADSYAEAEELLESMSDEEFEDVVEAFKEPDLDKMKRQEYRHQKRSTSQKGGSRGDSKNRASKMSSIRSALERGEDPRADGYGGARAARGNPPEDHRAAFSKNPMNNPPRKVKEPGVKEELEMQESWYSGAGSYRTTASGRKVRRDEDEATDTAVSDMLQKQREAAAKKAAQQKLKTQGLKRKDGTSVFEEVAEYLFVEGFADTIESAEVMAENISENWVNEIMEKFDPKDYTEYHQNNHRDKRNPSDEWDAQEKDWQDSRGDIRDKHNMKRGVKNKKGSKDINEKHVKALDTTGRGPDHRTRFPKFKGKDDEFDPKFTQQRVNRNDKKIDPYYSGRRERKSARRQGTGGFNA